MKRLATLMRAFTLRARASRIDIGAAGICDGDKVRIRSVTDRDFILKRADLKMSEEGVLLAAGGLGLL